MTRMNSRPIQSSVVFAQDTEPTSTVDGILWVNTSDPSRPTSVYSSDTENWEPVGAGIPIGMVSMWSGSIGSIPDGWALCDGTNDTPDLTDKFIVGAGQEYAAGETGGAKEVQLTEAEMPSHTHPMDQGDRSDARQDIYRTTNDQRSSGTTGSRGGDQPHENRPPYYALAYIMKTE